MFRIIIVAVAALALASPADAAHKRKRHKMGHIAPIATVPAASYGLRTPGPVWAQPWECYTDEGYGRYLPCGTGKDR